MARIDKKSRIRGLSAKLILQQRDSITGTYPAKQMIPSEGMDGSEKIKFDDESTIVFGSASNMIPGLNLEKSYVQKNKFIDEFGKDLYMSRSLVDNFVVLQTKLSNSNNPTYYYPLNENLNSFNGSGSFSTLGYGVWGTSITSPQYMPTASEYFSTPDAALVRQAQFINSVTSSVTSSDISNFNSSGSMSVLFVMKPLHEKTAGVAFSRLWGGNVVALEHGTGVPVMAINVEPNTRTFTIYHMSGSTIVTGTIGTNLWAATSSVPNFGSQESLVPKFYDTGQPWIHVAYVRKNITDVSQSHKLYIDGKFAGDFRLTSGSSVVLSHSNPTGTGTSQRILIGDFAKGRSTATYTSTNNQYSFSGLLKHLKIFDTALSESVVVDEYNLFSGFPKGQIKKDVGSDFISYRKNNILISPFVENNHSNITYDQTSGSFFTTGSAVSNVGEGFSSPVKSKTKIVINLTPSAVHSFKITNFSSESNRPMAYWNKDLKVWEGIGGGRCFSDYDSLLTTNQPGFEYVTAAYKSFFEEQTIGFTPGLSLMTTQNANSNSGRYCSSFFFPAHPKFAATSSNLISMSDYIHSEFLLEKATIELSCTFKLNNFSSIAPVGSVCNFFILNQRTQSSMTTSQSIALVSGNLETSLTLQFSLPSGSVTTTRDLVTWAEIASKNPSTDNSFNDGFFKNRDLAIPSTTNQKSQWSTNLNVKMAIKSPYKNQNLFPFTVTFVSSGQASIVANEGYNGNCVSFLSNEFFGRSNSNTINNETRSFVSVYGTGSISNACQVYVSASLTKSVDIYEEQYRENPYILLPGDELVFGWQLPYSNIASRIKSTGFAGCSGILSGSGPELQFSTMPAKITLYGSYIKEGKEYHDTLVQDLTSNTIHEVIG